MLLRAVRDSRLFCDDENCISQSSATEKRVIRWIAVRWPDESQSLFRVACLVTFRGLSTARSWLGEGEEWKQQSTVDQRHAGTFIKVGVEEFSNDSAISRNERLGNNTQSVESAFVRCIVKKFHLQLIGIAWCRLEKVATQA